MPATPRIAISIGGVCVALLLAGCAPAAEPIPTETMATASASPEPSPSGTSAPEGIAVDIACDDLVTDQMVYDWGSGNWAVDPDFSPAAGSSAEKVVDERGVACGWINLTSGDTLTVAVAQLPEEALEALKNELVTTSNWVPTYEVEGYFQVTAGVGQADVFPDHYWLVVASSVFLEPGDAEPIVRAAREALAG